MRRAIEALSDADYVYPMDPDFDGNPREVRVRIIVGKAARTAWRLLRVRGAQSLVEFRPATWRTHQIRVHAAEGLGAPVAGDPVYGRGGPHGPSTGSGQAMLLHAAELSVPREGKPPVEAKAPLPERFAAAGFGDPEAEDA